MRALLDHTPAFPLNTQAPNEQRAKSLQMLRSLNSHDNKPTAIVDVEARGHALLVDVRVAVIHIVVVVAVASDGATTTTMSGEKRARWPSGAPSSSRLRLCRRRTACARAHFASMRARARTASRCDNDGGGQTSKKRRARASGRARGAISLPPFDVSRCLPLLSPSSPSPPSSSVANTALRF